MVRSFGFLLLLSAALSGGVVLDRVAVIVGRSVVKASDVDRDLRATAFLNRQPLDMSAEAKKKAADRLVEQELIRQEILIGTYAQPSEQEATAVVNQLRRDRFQGSEPQFRAALTRYGLREEQLRAYMLWQLTVLRFIDLRFRPSVLVTDEDVKAYYEQHKLPAATPEQDAKVRETIMGERVNQAFEEWLDQSKRRARIEYRDRALAKE